MTHTPHERINHGGFHTHGQIKIKEKLTKTPTNMDRGKTRNKKHEKERTKLVARIFFMMEHISSKFDQ
jgi:hypothetical protein